MQEDNSSFSLLLDLLSELYQKQPKIGYHLLYYLRARWVGASPGCADSPAAAVITGAFCVFGCSLITALKYIIPWV